MRCGHLPRRRARRVSRSPPAAWGDPRCGQPANQQLEQRRDCALRSTRQRRAPEQAGRQLAKDIDSGLRVHRRWRHGSPRAGTTYPFANAQRPTVFHAAGYCPASGLRHQVGRSRHLAGRQSSLTMPAWHGDGARLAIRYGRAPGRR
ncbi:hypothetical protein DSL92_06710 [Billgrantia gudaonensis]|uniref:Uncharacterized protein n=1 Tax=Billgrantia gudaonensis TaxID=376427 RepID=A0A432JII7_9GAMM|nr:hypothetical protein DSL92_06710 [Halomonas gudaonensis]